MQAELKEKQISDFSFHITPEPKQLELKAEMTARFYKPKAENDPSGLLLVKAVIAAESADDFKLELVEQLVFNFEEKPESFDDAMNEVMEKQGRKIVSDDVDRILEGMGRNPLKIIK